MLRIHYSSLLAREFQSELESLLFFNPEQHRFREKILSAVEKYGVPSIQHTADHIRVALKNGPEVQTLFALAETGSRSKLVGVLIYLRTSDTTITVLQVAVKNDYSAQGRFYSQFMVPFFIARLREIGRQIKGITELQMLYGPEQVRSIPV